MSFITSILGERILAYPRWPSDNLKQSNCPDKRFLLPCKLISEHALLMPKTVLGKHGVEQELKTRLQNWTGKARSNIMKGHICVYCFKGCQASSSNHGWLPSMRYHNFEPKNRKVCLMSSWSWNNAAFEQMGVTCQRIRVGMGVFVSVQFYNA